MTKKLKTDEAAEQSQDQDTGLLALTQSQLSLFAQSQAESEASTAAGPQLLSTRNGRMTLDKKPIAGDQIDAIILCAPIERMYYDGPFDPMALVPPACSALGTNAQELQPDGSSAVPQSSFCRGCPKDAWGSAGTIAEPRKGKACRETRRIVFLAADQINSAADVRKADVYAIRPPVTSIQAFGDLVKSIARQDSLPTFAVVVNIKLVPDNKNQFRMEFTKVRAIQDLNLLTALMDRAKSELDTLLSSVTPPTLHAEAISDTKQIGHDEPEVDF